MTGSEAVGPSLHNVGHFDEISGAINQEFQVQVHLKLSGAHLKNCKKWCRCDFCKTSAAAGK